MACDSRKIGYWQEIKRVRNNGIESRKNLVCFQTGRIDMMFNVELHCLHNESLEWRVNMKLQMNYLQRDN